MSADRRSLPPTGRVTLSVLALIGRVITGRCEGGRALTNAAQQLCAFVLLVVVPAGLWQIAPFAWEEYKGLKKSIAQIEHTLEIRGLTDSIKDAEQDEKIGALSNRVDRLSDRVSRIEGRGDGHH